MNDRSAEARSEAPEDTEGGHRKKKRERTQNTGYTKSPNAEENQKNPKRTQKNTQTHLDMPLRRARERVDHDREHVRQGQVRGVRGPRRRFLVLEVYLRVVGSRFRRRGFVFSRLVFRVLAMLKSGAAKGAKSGKGRVSVRTHTPHTQ